MQRERQIELLVSAPARADARVVAWLTDPEVKEGHSCKPRDDSRIEDTSGETRILLKSAKFEFEAPPLSGAFLFLHPVATLSPHHPPNHVSPLVLRGTNAAVDLESPESLRHPFGVLRHQIAVTGVLARDGEDGLRNLTARERPRGVP